MTGPRRHHRTPVAGALLVLVAQLLAGCAQPPTTGVAIGRAVAGQFARLYVRQQTLLDRTGFTAGTVAASAACDRGGPAIPDRGAGDDWTCTVTYTPDTGLTHTLYDLTVTADGCYRAHGPLAAGQRLALPDGGDTTDPLFAFDGCTRP